MRSYGWVLSQYNWHYYRKGKFGHGHAQREGSVKRHREKTVIYKGRRRVWNRSFLHGPQKKSVLPTHWLWASSLQNHEAYICVAHDTQMWYPVPGMYSSSTPSSPPLSILSKNHNYHKATPLLCRMGSWHVHPLWCIQGASAPVLSEAGSKRGKPCL